MVAACGHGPHVKEDEKMNLLWGLAVLFFVMWLFGFAAFHVAGGFIHILLVLAVAVVLIRVVSGRRAI
jgi:energy-converting hydrogenase Eha subunit G